MKTNNKSKIVDGGQIIRKVKGQKEEFFEFLKNYNVIQLAIGVVLGNSAKNLVMAIVDDLIMPMISVLTPGGSWEERTIVVGPASFHVGNLLSNLLDFFIVAIVVYVVVKKIFKIDIGSK